MKITDIELQRYSWPRPKPISNGKYTYTTVDLNLVHVRTDQGLRGIGWASSAASGRASDVTAVLVDANNAYIAFEAVEIARKMEAHDVYWFEEPVAPDDYRGHAQVARASSIPVATGENEYTRYGFRDLIEHEAAAILNADAQILGGISEFIQVAALGAAHDLQIAPHGAQEIHIYLVAAIPNGLILEFYRETVDPLRGRIFKDPLTLDQDGCVAVPDRPGLGLEPDYELLAQYRVG